MYDTEEENPKQSRLLLSEFTLARLLSSKVGTTVHTERSQISDENGSKNEERANDNCDDDDERSADEAPVDEEHFGDENRDVSEEPEDDEESGALAKHADPSGDELGEMNVDGASGDEASAQRVNKRSIFAATSSGMYVTTYWHPLIASFSRG